MSATCEQRRRERLVRLFGRMHVGYSAFYFPWAGKLSVTSGSTLKH